MAAGGSRGWKTIQAGFSPSGTGTLRALRPGSLLLSSPVAPRDPPGQTKPKGAPVKRPQKTKAIQAQKLRNSAKGKVPKSALGKFGKGLKALPPVLGPAPQRRWRLRQGLKHRPGMARPTVCRARSGLLDIRR